MNSANFENKKWHSPQEMKYRFENHMGRGLNRTNNLFEENQLCKDSSTDLDMNKALTALKKIGFKNIKGKRKIRNVAGTSNRV